MIEMSTIAPYVTIAFHNGVIVLIIKGYGYDHLVKKCNTSI